MLPSYLQILRVYGLPSAEVAAILRAVRDQGCPGLRLLERDGEFAVCVQISAPTRAMAREYSEKWVQELRARFGDALYAEGGISLAQATLTALLQKRRLLVAADEPTGRLLGDALRPLPHSEAAFDFGNQTYLHAENARRIVPPPTLLKKFPGDLVQAAAGRALAALAVAGADIAVLYTPASVGQAPFVLLCDRRGAVGCAVDPEQSDGAIANQLLDLVRRRVLGLPPGVGAAAFRPGQESPPLLLSPEGQPRRGDTTRFSLRRARPKNVPTTGRDYEPMLDFDTATHDFGTALDLNDPRPAPAAPAAPAQPSATGHTGAIVFEDGTVPRPAPAPVLEDAPAPGDTAVEVRIPAPAPAAPAENGETAEVGAPPQGGDAAPADTAPPPSLLDGDIPDFTAPAPAGNWPRQDAAAAADRLFGHPQDPLPEARASALRTHSLEVIEKTERRRHRLVLLVLALLLCILLVGAWALVRFYRGDLGRQPSFKTYGTARFDEQAAAYLNNARQKQPGVLAYLAFPGQDGQLVYTAAERAQDAPALQGTSYLASAAPGHTVIDYGPALAALTELETLQANSGFTLYLPDAAYRYKVMAVYNVDPAETGPTAFDPCAYGDLANYRQYLAFTLGARVRSLYDTGVTVGQNASFLTLTGTDPADGTLLCVTGRQVQATESAALSAAAIRKAEQPLLPAARYRDGTPMPDLGTLLARELQNNAADRSALQQQAQSQGASADLDALDQQLAALGQQTEDMLAQADELMMQGLTDIVDGRSTTESDVNQGAAGTLPSQDVELPITPAAPTAAPTPVPPASDPGASSPAGGQSTAAPGGESAPPTAAPPPVQPAAPAETIDVTMNGTRQSMDLVQCLAMIATNELGYNAPAEAYKAQCVAAHCWILNEGDHPPVSGKGPCDAALAAAQEVARVLVTYNGKVAFTPYFASASKGTAASVDVWGGERAYLQAVDSPYDEQYADHWHTNGKDSGTARFSRATLQERIKSKLGIDLSGVDPDQWFKILSVNQYGWVARMQIGPDGGPNTTCRGSWFRETLLAGQSVSKSSLRSQCFTFTYNPESDCFEFDVYGYGHGVGLSQWGAIGYAANGWSYAQILTHYFTGTTLTSY